jgi:molybdopterin/thiamine biosynthesis adenylyltransferase
MSEAMRGPVGVAPGVGISDESQYRPVLYRAARASDRNALESLSVSSPGGLQIHDTFRQQLEGLIRCRHPRRAPTAAELEREVARYAEGRRPAELGVWVHYPWRRCVVHVLDESDFVELRTSRNRYKITAEEQALLGQRKVGIIGLSVGGQVALTLATERACGELRLADFDVLELSNLNRLREGVFHLGLAKTTLAARSIAELDPFLKVTCYHEGVTPENLDAFLTAGGQLDLLVEECDGLAMKLACRQRARELGIPVVMEANDRATLDIERFDRERTRPILHGLLDGLDLGKVGQLRSNDEKVPYLMPMVGEATMSDKLKASFLEVGESLETWPQLASDVALGAGLVTNVVRRIALGQLTGSGRYFVDLDQLVRDEPQPNAATESVEPAAPPASARLGSSAEPSRPLLAGQEQLSDASLDALLAAAALAPSGGNEQPWHWQRAGAELLLLPLRRFGDSLLNHADNASFLALGAAAENLVLRAHALGVHVQLEPPRDDQQQPLCRFRFFSSAAQAGLESHAWDDLAQQLEHRHTNRRRVAAAPVPAEQLEQLCAAVASLPGCALKFVSQPASIAEVAEVAAQADRIRMLHPLGQRDLVREIRWTREEAQRERDGIDLQSIDLTAAEHAGLRLLRSPRVAELLRSWKRGRSLERLTRSAVLAASSVGLLSAANDSIQDRFVAGRALQRGWLTATRLGLALQPHTACLFLFARARGPGAAAFDAEALQELLGLEARLQRAFETQAAALFLFRVFPGCPPLARSLRRAIQLRDTR